VKATFTGTFDHNKIFIMDYARKPLDTHALADYNLTHSVIIALQVGRSFSRVGGSTQWMLRQHILKPPDSITTKPNKEMTV
jgi:hypothetical protein